MEREITMRDMNKVRNVVKECSADFGVKKNDVCVRMTISESKQGVEVYFASGCWDTEKTSEVQMVRTMADIKRLFNFPVLFAVMRTS